MYVPIIDDLVGPGILVVENGGVLWRDVVALVPHLAEVDLGRGAEADVDRPPADEPGVATLRVVNGDQSGAGLDVVGTPFLNPSKSQEQHLSY